MDDIFVQALLSKFKFDGVGIILKGSPTVEDDLISFISSGKNLVMVFLNPETLKREGFPWFIISGKSYNTFQDYEKGFTMGMESQIEREEIAKRMRGEKIIW